MAMQSSSPVAALPSAQVIGNAFVEQYYHVLHRSPELVYKFYQDSSILSRPEPDGTMTSVATMQAINEKMQSMDYKNYKAEIKTADAQDSYQEGVMVLVTGCLTGTDNVKRKFTQTFFLAPQEKGYFVLNDIFRYVEEKESSETTASFVNGTTDIPLGVPSTSDAEPSLVADNAAFDSAPAPEAEDVQNGAEICDPSDIEEGSVLEEEVIEELPSKSQDEMVTIAVSDLSAAQEEKISYASIVRVPKSTARSTSVYIPTSNARATPTNANQQAHVPEKAYPNPQGSAYSVDGAPGSSNIQEEDLGYSIYVRNLPMNATAQQLEQEFKKFGSIKHDGIQVRSKQGFCFGFVEFESLESMQRAIKASTISIGGRQAAVEEKRTNTRVGSSGRGRYPPGRGGGFRGDTFRGRGNFGGSRGYGRSDFRNQGEFSTRPKGSSGRGVETYQRVDQSGSGSESGIGRRFSRQGSNKNGVSA